MIWPHTERSGDYDMHEMTFARLSPMQFVNGEVGVILCPQLSNTERVPSNQVEVVADRLAEYSDIYPWFHFALKAAFEGILK